MVDEFSDLFPLCCWPENFSPASSTDDDAGGESRIMMIREAIGYQIGYFFTHCVKGGGSNPCVKIYVADFYDSGGLLTT